MPQANIKRAFQRPKYEMKNDPISALSIIERFENLPVIQDLRNHYDFEACVVIETNGEVNFVLARDYSFSSQMRGRVRPQANKWNDTVCWFFECHHDGVLFALKFGTPLPQLLQNYEA